MPWFSRHAARPRPRRLSAAAIVSLGLFVLASCTAPASGTNAGPVSPSGPSTDGRLLDLGRNITTYVKQSGDRVIVVPNGTYSAGAVTAPHAATSGPYKGWLVLKSQSRHGVVVDLGGAPLTLEGATSRVLFVGFRFVNGPIYVNGSDIAFWHTDHSFPASVWAAQGRKYSSADTVHAYAPSTQRVKFFGSDLHDTGDAIDVSNSNGTRLEGVKIWNLSDMGVDPQDRIHPDAIDGVAGNVNNLTVAHSYIKGRVIIEDWNGTKGGPNTNLRFENMWVSHSPSSGFIFSTDKPSLPRGLSGALVNVRTWANNNGLGRIEVIDGRHYYQPNSQPSRVNIAHGVTTQPPAAGSPSPADQWRAAHGYDGWAYALQ